MIYLFTNLRMKIFENFAKIKDFSNFDKIESFWNFSSNLRIIQILIKRAPEHLLCENYVQRRVDFLWILPTVGGRKRYES